MANLCSRPARIWALSSFRIALAGYRQMCLRNTKSLSVRAILADDLN
jgi:hypothetical protein